MPETETYGEPQLRSIMNFEHQCFLSNLKVSFKAFRKEQLPGLLLLVAGLISSHVCCTKCITEPEQGFSVWPIRSEPFRSKPFRSGPFLSRDISVWGHFGHDISVHKQLITFVYLNGQSKCHSIWCYTNSL